MTEAFSVSPTHSWLCGVVVKTPDWENSGLSGLKYRIFWFLQEKPSLISLILNRKSEKNTNAPVNNGRPSESNIFWQVQSLNWP